MLEPLDVEIASPRGTAPDLFAATWSRDLARDLAAVLLVLLIVESIFATWVGRSRCAIPIESKAMNRIWQMLMGIERSSPGVVSGGDSHLEFASLPRGTATAILVLGGLFLLALLWRLIRWERRELSPPKRALLVGLRMLTLLAAAIMLVEPVLVSTRRETVPSHLMIVLDDSESMKFSDPYTDDSCRRHSDSRLKLESAGGKSPVDRLRETPRLELVKSVLGPNMEALARGRELFVYNLESRAQPGGSAASARTRKLDRHAAETPLFAPGRCPARRARRPSRSAGRRRGRGYGRTLQYRRRSAPRRRVRCPPEHPDLFHRRRGRRRPAQ